METTRLLEKKKKKKTFHSHLAVRELRPKVWALNPLLFLVYGISVHPYI